MRRKRGVLGEHATMPVLPPAESLTVEFKSDRAKLSDHELVEALVCLADAEGRELWLGVEDDVTPTGLHKDHVALDGLAGLVAARTSPSLTVTMEGAAVPVTRWRPIPWKGNEPGYVRYERIWTDMNIHGRQPSKDVCGYRAKSVG